MFLLIQRMIPVSSLRQSLHSVSSSLCFDSAFIRALFPENLNAEKKGRPTTAGSKIKVCSVFHVPCSVLHVLCSMFRIQCVCCVCVPLPYQVCWGKGLWQENMCFLFSGVSFTIPSVFWIVMTLTSALSWYLLWLLSPETSQWLGEHTDEMYSTLHPLHQAKWNQEAQRLGGESVSDWFSVAPYIKGLYVSNLCFVCKRWE